jgi:hypothetical protein
MFAHCSVANIFKYGDPTIRRGGTNSWQWQQCLHGSISQKYNSLILLFVYMNQWIISCLHKFDILESNNILKWNTILDISVSDFVAFRMLLQRVFWYFRGTCHHLQGWRISQASGKQNAWNAGWLSMYCTALYTVDKPSSQPLLAEPQILNTSIIFPVVMSFTSCVFKWHATWPGGKVNLAL